MLSIVSVYLIPKHFPFAEFSCLTLFVKKPHARSLI